MKSWIVRCGCQIFVGNYENSYFLWNKVEFWKYLTKCSCDLCASLPSKMSVFFNFKGQNGLKLGIETWDWNLGMKLRVETWGWKVWGWNILHSTFVFSFQVGPDFEDKRLCYWAKSRTCNNYIPAWINIGGLHVF